MCVEQTKAPHCINKSVVKENILGEINLGISRLNEDYYQNL